MSAQTERIRDLLEKLEQNEHEQIFTIIRKYTHEYTRSDNGIFVSSKSLPTECLDEIDQYIHFCFAQREHLQEGEQIRTEYEKLVKTGKTE
jgi:hypothetical protein